MDNFKQKLTRIKTLLFDVDGVLTDEVPFQISKVNIEPQYKAFKGWNCDSTVLKNAADLPADMSVYVDFINAYIGAPVKYVSNGPGREQLIVL